ncbi:hypothetical protein McanMca71_004771 [Microsporum canis]|uniref:Uncharacterized protein n=1 Tax=Arthroderma otae (strain ATCC MYA-4605 / CBS 113480) TaxID=554155 RepID=C5FZQ8_ARTOC|nr:uncharacterized protein MCYG_08180 [Microsporum canis CBS 113480]EEQ35361.1 predicted protein [Microsporum canis CBS 113480]
MDSIEKEKFKSALNTLMSATPDILIHFRNELIDALDQVDKTYLSAQLDTPLSESRKRPSKNAHTDAAQNRPNGYKRQRLDCQSYARPTRDSNPRQPSAAKTASSMHAAEGEKLVFWTGNRPSGTPGFEREN